MAQQETRIVDSLMDALIKQDGREKVLTMIELTWDFYDVSYDDCLDWGEKAIREAQKIGYGDLEAKANYALGIQYAYHGDLDLAKLYLQRSYSQFVALGDTKNAFESLWNMATYELSLGNIDTAYQVYEKAIPLSHQLDDTGAYASIISNMALIWYNRNQLDTAYRTFAEATNLFESIGDDLDAAKTRSSMATIYYEKGRAGEAKDLFKEIIPTLEKHGDNYYLLSVCGMLGKIYENELVDYDSAMYYLQKAVAHADMPMVMKEDKVSANKEKSEVMTEMAKVMERQGRLQEALEEYEAALRQAVESSYLQGQMVACLGLGHLYGRLGEASKSLSYLNRFFELEKATGITKYHQKARKPLIMDYARLGLFDKMEMEMTTFDEEFTSLVGENIALDEQHRVFGQEIEDLLRRNETLDEQFQKQQKQLHHYRLAFFGLLAIILMAMALGLARKIVRKKRTKSVKS